MIAKKSDIFKRKKVKEEDFLNALDIISKKLIYKFKFGYHEIEDMKQQAAIFALEGLENYDNKRPLENFLWTHVRNRLFNFKRDNYFRPDNVCVGCPFFDPSCSVSINQCAKFKNKNDCPIFSQSEHRNSLKKSLMKPVNIDHNNPTDLKAPTDLLSSITNSELIGIIEDHMETKYRETYLRLKGGSKVPKADLIKLQEHILEILKIHKLNPEDL